MLLERQCFEFDEFLLEGKEKVLLKNGTPVKITPKAFRLLHVLIENHGHLISKEELMKRVWSGSFVEDGNLAFTIRVLRKILGDDRENPRFIETVQRRGYRFVGNVRGVESSPSQNSIAVLPFANMSAEAENEYFCDGLTEELINALSKIENLKVAARTSAFSFKGKNTNVSQIGRDLNVNTILEGSVRKSENRLRITVQLISAADGYHLWSEKYDRKMQDIFDVQDEITLAVVGELRGKLFGEKENAVLKRHTSDAAAYQHYLHGRFFWNKRTAENFQKAIEYFKRAIDLDSDYALAYAGLADCYNALGYYEVFSPQELAPQAKAAALKALALDDTLAESHASFAIYKTFYEFDWANAINELKRAIEMNPNYAPAHHWLSTNYALTKQFEQSFDEGERAIRLDPLAPIVIANVARTRYVARRYDEARELSLKTLEIAPNYFLSLWMLGIACWQIGKRNEAIEKLRQAILSHDTPRMKADLAGFLAEIGQTAEARNILAELKTQSGHSYVSPLNLMKIYVGLGENQKALHYLEKAFAERSVNLMWLSADPAFDKIRDERRFQDILRRIGLPQ